MKRIQVDTYKHKGLRKKLIEEIIQKGITDVAVLNAIENIPRHFFLDSAFEYRAYEDKAFRIAADQTISQPYTVAFQTQTLNVLPHQKVLEVGTGSAYQACVLAKIGARVYTIERQKELFDSNKSFFYLKQFPNIRFFYGDGYAGLPTYAPFDRIIITAASPEIPPKLLEQLVVGGVMVVPVGPSNAVQQMKKVTRVSVTEYSIENLGDFSFVSMLPGKNP